VINIQTRVITDELTSLVKQLDALVDPADGKGNHAFVVLLTDDADAAEEKLTDLAEKNEIKNIPLTVFDGIAGPGSYKIAEEADVTIMMWKGLQVEKNYAFGKDGLTAEAVKKILKDAEDHLK